MSGQVFVAESGFNVVHAEESFSASRPGEEDISDARSPEQEATSSSSPTADVDQGSSEGVVASSLSEEPPARLPGFEESAAAQNMRDAA